MAIWYCLLNGCRKSRGCWCKQLRDVISLSYLQNERRLQHTNAVVASLFVHMNHCVDPMPAFPCLLCGLCCQHVHLAAETRFLDRGDGTCKHYEATSKLCSIYVDRPDICRVERQYAMIYSRLYAWDEYVALNLQICASLQEQEKLRSSATAVTGSFQHVGLTSSI